MTIETDIADAVATILASAPEGTFDQAFDVARSWLPEQQLASLDRVVVRVVPGPVDETPLARAGYVQCDLTIDAVVLAKLSAVTNEAVDPLAALAKALRVYLHGKAPVQNVAFRYSNVVSQADKKALREFTQYASNFQVHYRYVEARP